MDSSQNSKYIFFLFLLLSTNLLTLFLSSTFYSSYNCPLPIVVTTTDSATTSIPDSGEFFASSSPQKLPLGFNRNFDSNTIYPSIGRACSLFPDDLRRYMSYQINGSCPDDELLAQKLLLKGCEPLPRRRCRPAAPARSVEPHPFPASLWTTPPDASVVWTAYTCKNYSCLVNRARQQKGFDDCKDCFDLQGRERTRWMAARGGLDFSIDEVLGLKKPGTIRVGLDIGGGSGTFAVRMRERNVTIVTTSMNFNGPFNNFIAGRGVVALYISISQRLPFFDNTLDLVHSMHVLSNWIPVRVFHFLLFDVYRVLRPGGVFWLDHFFCLEAELEEVYVPMIKSVGFGKVKWVVGKKLDHWRERREVYLSALLEKPLNNSWGS